MEKTFLDKRNLTTDHGKQTKNNRKQTMYNGNQTMIEWKTDMNIRCHKCYIIGHCQLGNEPLTTLIHIPGLLK